MVVFEPVGLLILVIGLPLALWPYEIIRNTVEFRASATELAGGGQRGIDGHPPNWVSLARLAGVVVTILGIAVLFGVLG